METQRRLLIFLSFPPCFSPAPPAFYCSLSFALLLCSSISSRIRAPPRPCPEPRALAYDRVPKCTCVCAERRPGESRSRGGAARSPTARKDKDSRRAREYARVVLIGSRTQRREATTARTNLRSCQDNLCDITPASEQRGRGPEHQTLRLGSSATSGGCSRAAFCSRL